MDDDFRDGLGLILQKIMSGPFEKMDLGVRETALPFGQIIEIEDEIMFAPADQHGDVPQAVQVVVDKLNERKAWILTGQGDVLDEAERGDAVLGTIIGGQEALPNFAGQATAWGHDGGGAGEKVQPQDGRFGERPGVAYQTQAKGNRLPRRGQKPAGIGDNDPPDAFYVP